MVASSNTLTAAGISAGDSISFATTFAGNVKHVTDFSIGVDKLNVVAANTTDVAYGNYDPATGTFVIAGGYALGTSDALVVLGNGLQTAMSSSGYQVLTGLTGALTAGDFS